MNKKKVERYRKHLEHIDPSEYPAMYGMISHMIQDVPITQPSTPEPVEFKRIKSIKKRQP